MASTLSCALFLLLLRSCVAEKKGGEVCRLGFYGGPLFDGAPQCPRLDEADAKACCASGETCLDLPRCSAKVPRKAGAGSSPAAESSRGLLAISGVSAAVLRQPRDTAGSRGDSVEGEQCHKWLPGQDAPTESFWCPTQYNPPEDRFCCGTCMASHCCSNAKDRLDQASCSRGTPPTTPPGEGQEAEGSVQPLPEEAASVNYAALAMIVTGVAGFCIWTGYFVQHVRDRVMIHNWQRAGNVERGGVEYERSAEGVAVDPSRAAACENPLPHSPGAAETAITDCPGSAELESPLPLSQVAIADPSRPTLSKEPPRLTPGPTEPDILTEAMATDASSPVASEDSHPPGAEESQNPCEPPTALRNPPDSQINCQHSGNSAEQEVLSPVLPAQDLHAELEEVDTAL